MNATGVMASGRTDLQLGDHSTNTGHAGSAGCS